MKAVCFSQQCVCTSSTSWELQWLTQLVMSLAWEALKWKGTLGVLHTGTCAGLSQLLLTAAEWKVL